MWKESETFHTLRLQSIGLACSWNVSFSFFFFFFFGLFSAIPAAYGGSQARGPVGLCHRHSNAISDLGLQSTTQFKATLDP